MASSWGDWGKLSKFAQAAKEMAESAQKTIDQVLDIQEDDDSGERPVVAELWTPARTAASAGFSTLNRN